MKIFMGLLAILIFAGCQGGGGGEQSPEAPSIPSPVPPVKTDIVWGELPCQKEKSCENQFLNIEFNELKEALKEFYSESPIENEDPNYTSFLCGQDFYNFCYSIYQWDIETVEVDFDEMRALANQVLEIEKCELKPDLNNNLNNYLTNTKEYKDVR